MHKRAFLSPWIAELKFSEWHACSLCSLLLESIVLCRSSDALVLERELHLSFATREQRGAWIEALQVQASLLAAQQARVLLSC